MLPSAMIENCSAIGKAMRRCSQMNGQSQRQSRFLIRRIGNFRRISSRQSPPDSACEITVAAAAPRTPQPKLVRNQ